MTRTSQSVEDYIKAIFMLAEEHEPVQTSALAERLAVRPASVSNMLRRLQRDGLIRYELYRGATLTRSGDRLARLMVRRHRLIERFLTEILDYPWEAVHDEAERLEHAVSPHFIEAIDRLLERPSTDPHGDPIPGHDGAMVVEHLPTLDQRSTGDRSMVRRVSDDDADMLREYRRLGLRPRATVEVVDTEPRGGPLTIRVAGAVHRLTREAASGVFVEVLP